MKTKAVSQLGNSGVQLLRRSVALAVLAGMPLLSQAATVNLTANNAVGTSSFASNLAWSDASAPSAGNDYVTQGYLLRTPSAGGSYTFAGGSLLVGGGVAGGAFTPGVLNNNAFLNKTPGTAVITVNNMTLNGSSIRDGQGSTENWTLQGNLLVTGLGGNLACQETFHLNSVVSGNGPLYIADNGSGDASRVVNIGSSLNTYDGSISLGGTTAARSRLTFIDNSRMNFTIGAAGVNNRISTLNTGTGTVNLNGDFFINLAGASSLVGDTWNLVNTTGLTALFGSTFTVNGFSDIGGDQWQADANGVSYVFSETSGNLTVVAVPEPGTMTLVGLGVAGLLAARRRRA